MRILVGFVLVVALWGQAQPDARSLLMHAGGSVLLAGTVRLEGRESAEVEWNFTRRKEQVDSVFLYLDRKTTKATDVC